MNVEDADPELSEHKRLEHLVDASEAIVLKAAFQLMAGIDHKEVYRELAASHEELWNREGNQDLLPLIIARMNEKSTDE